MNSLWSRLALALVVTSVLAGCGGSSSDTGTTASDAGTTVAGETATADQASGAPIKVGAISTLSGPAAFPDTTDAAKAVFDDVNAHGGIRGRPIEYVVEDDKADPQAAAQAARHLIDEEGVVATVGSTSLLECGVNAELYRQRNLLAIEGPSPNPACFASSNIIPIGVGLFGSVRLMLQYAATDLGKTRICALLHKLQGTEAGYAATISDFENATGVKLAYDERNLSATDDPTPYIIQAKNAGCEALVFSGAPPQVIAIVKAAHAQGIADEMALLAIVPAYTQAVAQALGTQGDGLYANTDFVPWSDAGNPALTSWSALMDEAGVPKTYFSQAGYLVARAFVDALRRVKGEIDRDSVTEAIDAMTAFQDPMLLTPLSYAPAETHLPPLVSRVVQLGNGDWNVVSDVIEANPS